MKPKLIVIGASAGGVPAIHQIISMLPSEFQIPIAVVLHLPAHAKIDFKMSYSRDTNLPITEVEDKMPILNGNVYFAPPAYHTLVEKEEYFSLSLDEPVHFSRPSIDVLFQSVAQAFGAQAVGVLLTGANEDGAQGLKAISEAGGQTLVQDPQTADVATMPRSAIQLFQPSFVGGLSEIAHKLVQINREDLRS